MGTTGKDFGLWVRNLLAPGLDVGGAWLVKTLETPGKLSNGRAIHYGGGLDIDHVHGLLHIHHLGSWQGFRTAVSVFPEKHLGVYALCNSSKTGPGRRVRKMAAVFLPILKNKEHHWSAPDLWRHRGYYVSSDHRQIWRIRKKHGHVVMGPLYGMTNGWDAGEQPDSFVWNGMTARFSHKDGKARIRLEPAGTVLIRREQSRHRPLDGNRAGCYRSQALQVTWCIKKKGHKFYLYRNGANLNRLDVNKRYSLYSSAAAGIFGAGPYVLEFGGDEFWLFGFRASGIHFVRTD